jgi:hypothetical protein
VTYEPARIVGLIHAVVTALVAAGVLSVDDIWVRLLVVAVGVAIDFIGAEAVRNRVVPLASAIKHPSPYTDPEPPSNPLAR